MSSVPRRRCGRTCAYPLVAAVGLRQLHGRSAFGLDPPQARSKARNVDDGSVRAPRGAPRRRRVRDVHRAAARRGRAPQSSAREEPDRAAVGREERIERAAAVRDSVRGEVVQRTDIELRRIGRLSGGVGNQLPVGRDRRRRGHLLSGRQRDRQTHGRRRRGRPREPATRGSRDREDDRHRARAATRGLAAPQPRADCRTPAPARTPACSDLRALRAHRRSAGARRRHREGAAADP